MPRVRRVVALLGCVTLTYSVALSVTMSSAEQLMEPGEWKVTLSGVMNGQAMPSQVKHRCITPEQADDVAGTFGPVSGTINPAVKLLPRRCRAGS